MNAKTMITTAGAIFLAFSACAADDIIECRAAKERADAELAVKSPIKSSRLVANAVMSTSADESGWKTYEFYATGDLNDVVGSGTLDFAFAVDVPFTEIKSATLSMNAWDVDYPIANYDPPEHDIVYFNGARLGRLQGGNQTYHINTFPVSNNAVRYPKTDGDTAENTFYIAVDIGDDGWVTGISWAKLTIVGKTGITVKATDGEEPDKVTVSWIGVPSGTPVTVYRDWFAIKSGVMESSYEDKTVVSGQKYIYHILDLPHFLETILCRLASLQETA